MFARHRSPGAPSAQPAAPRVPSASSPRASYAHTWLKMRQAARFFVRRSAHLAFFRAAAAAGWPVPARARFFGAAKKRRRGAFESKRFPAHLRMDLRFSQIWRATGLAVAAAGWATASVRSQLARSSGAMAAPAQKKQTRATACPARCPHRTAQKAHSRPTRSAHEHFHSRLSGPRR